MKRFKDFRFIIIVVSMMLAMVALMAVTGCTSAVGSDNDFFLVSEDYLNGYGCETTNVYVMDGNGNLYVAGGATDKAVIEKYPDRGFSELMDPFSVVGVYVPLGIEDRGARVTSLCSYGDIQPVILKKGEDKLFSKKDYGVLDFYPVKLSGKGSYSSLWEKYGQKQYGFVELSEKQDCNYYTVDGSKIEVYSYATTSDGVIYDIDDLPKGLYLINDTCGIIEIK